MLNQFNNWLRGSYGRELAGNGKRHNVVFEFFLWIWVMKLKKCKTINKNF